MTDRNRWHGTVKQPEPRAGDELANARMIINAARLVLPSGAPQPGTAGANTKARRAAITVFLREHEVPVPEFVPVVYGWVDCFTGQLANPKHEPGADGRRFS